MAPVVSIVGRSMSGKTTLIEKLIPELKSRGYRVATIKHAPLGVEFGDQGKNSERHLQAGSEAVVMSSPDRLVMIKPLHQPPTIDQTVDLLGEDYDIILVEGFKQGDAPKIEVHRKEIGTPLKDLKKLFAIATDEPLDTKVRQFSLDDVKGIADLLEEGFIKPFRERLVFRVNDADISLTSFPREIVTNVLLGLANSLKGVSQVKTLKIFLKRE